MQIFHELGHVLGGLMTGAEIEKVYLHPLTLSRTDFSSNPNPLLTVWMGPVIGVVLPFILYLIASIVDAPKLYFFKLFSGFCFIANGIYISFGFSFPSLDSGMMLAYGTPLFCIIGFGIVTIPLGLFLWNNLCSYFGFGKNVDVVPRKDILISFCLFLALILAEICYSSF